MILLQIFGATILFGVLLPLILLLIPFISILMLLKINRERRINTGIKKGIKSGVWLNEYKYTISPKFQKKIDKLHLKNEKKLIKKGGDVDVPKDEIKS